MGATHHNFLVYPSTTKSSLGAWSTPEAIRSSPGTRTFDKAERLNVEAAGTASEVREETRAAAIRTTESEPPLSDEEFEKLCLANDLFQMERTKDGKIEVNPPAGGFTSDGNAETTHQLRAWRDKKQVLVYESAKEVRIETGAAVKGTWPVEGFTLNPKKVWRRYEPEQ